MIECHREKAGTIEGVHDVLKNELAAEVMPSKPFGANAAWLRMAVIAYNVMTALKRLALPVEMLTARPNRLRFLIFNSAGRVVHPSRSMVLRLAATAGRLGDWLKATRLLPIRVQKGERFLIDGFRDPFFWREAGRSAPLDSKRTSLAGKGHTPK